MWWIILQKIEFCYNVKLLGQIVWYTGLKNNLTYSCFLVNSQCTFSLCHAFETKLVYLYKSLPLTMTTWITDKEKSFLCIVSLGWLFNFTYCVLYMQTTRLGITCVTWIDLAWQSSHGSYCQWTCYSLQVSLYSPTMVKSWQ